MMRVVLNGTTNIVGKTISSILFNATSSIGDVNGFNRHVSLNKVNIAGSGGTNDSEFIRTLLP
ncbi:hypothetical protein M422DRAFT_250034 [Sphaerobolus stellatus SS14]|nr:hypothetical protein M422DRAFT_250034 [Sphaerobolus stellatus SS14]